MAVAQPATLGVDEDAILAIASRLDLREPNVEAVRAIAYTAAQHYEIEKRPPPYECVVDVATGVGKTFVLAAAIEYYAALGRRALRGRHARPHDPPKDDRELHARPPEEPARRDGRGAARRHRRELRDGRPRRGGPRPAVRLQRPVAPQADGQAGAEDAHVPRDARRRVLRLPAGARRPRPLCRRAPRLLRAGVLGRDPRPRAVDPRRPHRDAASEDAARADRLRLPARARDRRPAREDAR